MANEGKSFEELLSEAPLAADTSTVMVFGALARAPEAGKFVLTLANGTSVTLESKAVKSFARLGGAIGQLLVQLELDAKLVPKDFDRLVTPISPYSRQTGVADQLGAYVPTVKPPILETLVQKFYGSDAPWMGGGDGWPVFGGSYVPYALATGHQAPASTVAAMEHANALLRAWSSPFMEPHLSKFHSDPKNPPDDR